MFQQWNKIFETMLFTTAITLIFLLQTCKSQETARPQSSPTDIVFDTADITTRYHVDNGDQYTLQAFKTKVTNRILSTRPSVLAAGDILTLRWVTPGICQFIPNQVVFGQQYVEFKILCLTDRIATTLASKAQEQYDITINPSQILMMPFSKFTCKATIFTASGEKVVLHGKVPEMSFRRHPLKFDIEAPRGSAERSALQSAVNRNETVDFYCTAYANGRVQKKNTLVVDFNTEENSEYVEQLLGPADSKFVTRHQMNRFAKEMFTSLSIEESYEIPEHTFANNFISDFINMASVEGFKPEPIRSALELMSKYATDITQDISPDTIIRELGSLYTVNETGGVKHIVSDVEKMRQFATQHGSSLSDSTSVSIGGSFMGIGASTSVTDTHTSAQSNAESTAQRDRRLQDELNQANSKVVNQVNFEIQGRKVIPKSLNVAKIIRQKLVKKIKMSRIRKEEYLADYEEHLHLRINDPLAATVIPESFRQIDELRKYVQQTEAATKQRISAAERTIITNNVNVESKVRVEESRTNRISQFFRNTKFISKCRMCYCDNTRIGSNSNIRLLFIYRQQNQCGNWILGDGSSEFQVSIGTSGDGGDRERFRLECQSISADV